jgi:hypothetical protein
MGVEASAAGDRGYNNRPHCTLRRSVELEILPGRSEGSGRHQEDYSEKRTSELEPQAQQDLAGSAAQRVLL